MKVVETRKSHRSITPVIQKKEAFYSAPRSGKHSQTKGINPMALSSHENVKQNKLFMKMNKSGELESIEKDKGNYSTISIEQDIANLENIKIINNKGDNFVLEFNESEEQFNQMKNINNNQIEKHDAK